MSIAYLLFIGISILSYAVQASLQNKYKKYSKVPVSRPYRGCDVAAKMLHDHGINDVQVTSTKGTLTDFFNPQNRTVNLSDGVYGTNSIMAAAVAAHECGHAVQHTYGYAPLKLRTILVPIVSFASQWVTWVLLAGIIFIQAFPGILAIGVVLFALTTLFSFITLPVEIDASRRAIAWLEQSGIAGSNVSMAKDALRSAAYTYVIAALSSLATLVYYAMILLGSRRN